MSTISEMPASQLHALVMRTFSERLKQARIEAGYKTAARFAFAFGVPAPRYRHWERGKCAPGLRELERLCLVLCVSANYLLPVPGRDGSPSQ